MNLSAENIRSIPCTLMRGGTSKGPFFLASDLPPKGPAQEQVILEALGARTASRIDGIGGLDTLSNKVAVVSRSAEPEVDVDYLFYQAKLESYALDASVNCGNMLSAVAPFAIEKGLVRAERGETTVRIRNLNTKVVVHAVVQTPTGRVTYDGAARVDGVAGSAAPILLDFRNAVGSKTGRLLPTGVSAEVIEGLRVTCLDVGVPMVLFSAESLGLKGHESPAELSANAELLTRMETVRRIAGDRMGLGDVRDLVVPKMAILSKARNGGTITSRYFTPKAAHTSHAVTGTLCVGAACLLPGTVAWDLAASQNGNTVTIEHPAGKMDVVIEASLKDGTLAISRAALLRTARKLFDGEVFVSEGLGK